MGLSLSEYYRAEGILPGKWHIGAEHPKLEEYALEVLRTLPRARVLEIGFQAGGFAVPVIKAMHARPDFLYVGVDSLVYDNAVPGDLIAAYLKSEGITSVYRFLQTDAQSFLSKSQVEEFDLILIDHFKPLYPEDLLTTVRNGLLSPYGAILMHDVLGEARAVAPLCEVIARAYGYSWTVTAIVPAGLAVLRRESGLGGHSISLFKGIWRGSVVAHILSGRVKRQFGYFWHTVRRRLLPPKSLS